MTSIVRTLLACSAAIVLADPALAARHLCEVPHFSGSGSRQGAVATMTVSNAAKSCRTLDYGDNAARQNPAESGSITKAREHGTAENVAPRSIYHPQPGYVGDDSYEYIATARSQSNNPVELKVHVDVKVVADDAPVP